MFDEYKFLPEHTYKNIIKIRYKGLEIEYHKKFYSKYFLKTEFLNKIFYKTFNDNYNRNFLNIMCRMQRCYITSTMRSIVNIYNINNDEFNIILEYFYSVSSLFFEMTDLLDNFVSKYRTFEDFNKEILLQNIIE